MMFCILFNYSTLRSIKDGFVVTGIGPEAISFLKTYVVLPSAVIMMVVYAKLCNIMSPQKVFYTIAWFFSLYLVFFAFVLYPYPEFFHPNHQTIEGLVIEYPNLKWFIRICGQWSIASFYAISELYGSMMLSLLFWQFANQITKTSEAKRFYSMFGLRSLYLSLPGLRFSCLRLRNILQKQNLLQKFLL
jgi:AAA family ATP:ADP antiporter